MKRTVCIVLLLVIGSFAMAQEAPKWGGSIKVGLVADLATMYPWVMTDWETIFVLENVYEPLIRLKKDYADIEPCLATHWKSSDDYRECTIYLRKGVKFHDGTPFNADAVLNTLAQSPTFPAEIKKIDDYTVLFKLKEPNAGFVVTLSMEYYSIASAATVKCFKDKCSKVPVYGTGPFKFHSWEPNKRVVLRANENYWGGEPYLKEAVFMPYGDNAKTLQALKDKAIDICYNIPPQKIEELHKFSHIVLYSKPSLTLSYLGMNVRRPPFDDKRVRIALGYAVNKKAIVEKYFYKGEAGTTAKSCIPSEMFGYDKAMPEREYDPEKAKALLKEAGYPDGFDTTLLPPGAARPYAPSPERMAEDIQNDLLQVGVKARIVRAKSWLDYVNIIFNGTYDITLFGWMADTVDPNDFLTSVLSSDLLNTTNVVKWSNSQFDEVLKQARGQNPDERVKLYQRAQQLFYEDMPFIPIANAFQVGASSARVKDFTLHPAPRLYLLHLWLNE